MLFLREAAGTIAADAGAIAPAACGAYGDLYQIAVNIHDGCTDSTAISIHPRTLLCR